MILESFRYGKANLFHVGVTVLVVFGLWIIMTTVSIAAGLPAYLIEFVLSGGSQEQFYLSSFAVYVVKALISLIREHGHKLFYFQFVFSKKQAHVEIMLINRVRSSSRAATGISSCQFLRDFWRNFAQNSCVLSPDFYFSRPSRYKGVSFKTFY